MIDEDGLPRLPVSKKGGAFMLDGRWEVPAGIPAGVARHLAGLHGRGEPVTWMHPLESVLLREHMPRDQWVALMGGTAKAPLVALMMPGKNDPRPATKAQAGVLKEAAARNGLSGVAKALTRLEERKGTLPRWWFASMDEVLSALKVGGASVSSPGPGRGTLGYRLFWLFWPMLSVGERSRWRRMASSMKIDADDKRSYKAFGKSLREAGILWDKGVRLMQDIEPLAQGFQRAYNGIDTQPAARRLAAECERRALALAGPLVAPRGRTAGTMAPGDVRKAWTAHFNLPLDPTDGMGLIMLDPDEGFDVHPWLARDPAAVWMPDKVTMHSSRFGIIGGRKLTDDIPSDMQVWRTPMGGKIMRGPFNGIDAVRPLPLAEWMLEGREVTVGDVVDLNDRYMRAAAPWQADMRAASLAYEPGKAPAAEPGKVTIRLRRGDGGGGYWQGFDWPLIHQHQLSAGFLDIVSALQSWLNRNELPRGAERVPRGDVLGLVSRMQSWDSNAG